MAEALKIDDRDSLERWLEDKPADWARLIALRAALRVFPLVGRELANAGEDSRAIFQGLVLAVWRGLLISSVARHYPTDEMRAAASASADAARAATRAASSASATAAAARAAASATDAAAFAARDAAADATARAVYAARASSSSTAAFAAAHRAAAWESISCDCAILGRDGPGELESAPLWLKHSDSPDHEPEPVIATPEWVQNVTARLADDLVSALGPGAALIAEWYRPLLSGGVNADWSRMFLGDRARDLALEKDAFWEVTEKRPAEKIMEDIAEALGWNEQDQLGVDPPQESDETFMFLSTARAETAYVGDNVDGSVDFLQRSEIAFALASQLNDVWDVMNSGPQPVKPFDSAYWTGLFKRVPKDTLEPGFVVHVDAPWGGGKTTFAQYLVQILNPYRLPDLPAWLEALPLGDATKWKKEHRRPWHVVHFNAWQHEHVSPPWWVFYEAIRKAATDASVNERNCRWADQPPTVDETANRPAEPDKTYGYDDNPCMVLLKRFEFWAGETSWRILTGGTMISIIGTLATAAVLWVMFSRGWFTPDPAKLKDIPSAMQGISTFGIALLTTIFGGGAVIRNMFTVFTRSLLPGTPAAANNYSLGSGDPLQRIRKHFLVLTKRLIRPIVVVVDDLDRCNAKFVTELVRGMQTILASPRVVYVLLGDRDWIEQAFAEVNKEMKGIDVGPEHSFGGRFVEKAIQLSMVLPAITKEVRESYVEHLLAPEKAGGARIFAVAGNAPISKLPALDLDTILENARNIVSVEEQESVEKIDQQVREALSKTSFRDRESAAQQVFESLKSDGGSNLRQIREAIGRSFGRELDFLAVGDKEAGIETRHMLLALAPALPPNPRQIKRILNTLTLNQQVMTKLYPEHRAGSRQWQQLARWVVLAVEWPMSWFTLTKHPELADVVLEMAANNPTKTKVNASLKKVDGDLLPEKARALAEMLNATKPVVELLTFRADEGWPDAPINTTVINWLKDIMPATSGRMLELPENRARRSTETN